MVPICPVAIWQFSRAFPSNWIFLWWYFFSLFLWRRRWWRFGPHTLFFLPWRRFPPPFYLHDPALLWGKVVWNECVSWFYTILWVIEGMFLWSLGFEFFIPTSAVRPTVFPKLDRVAHKILQPLSAHCCPIAGFCFGRVIDPLRFSIFLCSCPCLVVSF